MAAVEQQHKSFNVFNNHEMEVRYLGWLLLTVWLLAIIYMTRDFWFPTAFRIKSEPVISESLLLKNVTLEQKSKY